MPRTSLPQYFRPSDVIHISANGRGKTGRRGVVVSRETFDATTKVLYRGIVKSSNGEHISETVEGFTSLSNRILHPIQGVWEGQIHPGSPGRIVEYNDQPFDAVGQRQRKAQKGEAIMPTKPKGKSAKPAAKRAAAKPAAARSERATEAQLDRDAAKVVKMRDQQGKSWAEIAEALDIAMSRLRALYNRGGGAPSGNRSSNGAAKGRAASKPAAKGRTGAAKKPAARGRGKRNPS